MFKGFVALSEKRKKEVKSGRADCVCMCVPAQCTHVCCPSSLFTLVSSFVGEDLETSLSIPGSQSPSIVTFNDLHMELANAGYSNIPAYCNVRADHFS